MSDDSGGRAPISYAYLAGFLDGEGWFGGRGLMSAAGTDLRIFEEFAATFGGTVYTHTDPSQPGRERARPTWVWRLGRTETADLIPKLLPYLRTKYDVARATHRMATLPLLQHRTCACEECAWIRAQRVALKHEIHALNRKGA